MANSPITDFPILKASLTANRSSPRKRGPRVQIADSQIVAPGFPNTSLGRCCHGTQLRSALIGRPVRDCPASSRWSLDPANRGSSGSRAIDDLSRAEAQQRPSASVTNPPMPSSRHRRGAGRAPAWNASPTCAAPSSERLAKAGRPNRSPAGSRARPVARHQLREHLPLHLRPDRPHQGLSLAVLPAPRQEQARLPRPPQRQLRQPSSKAVFPSPNGLPRSPTATPPATGKPTSCCSPSMARRCSPCTSVTPA